MTPTEIRTLANAFKPDNAGCNDTAWEVLNACANVVECAEVIVDLPDTDRDLPENEEHFTDLDNALARLEELEP